jgi:hypothetical protein
VVGVDLGGTKVIAAVSDLSGTIIAEIEQRTSRAGGDAVVAQLSDLVRSVARDGGVPFSPGRRSDHRLRRDPRGLVEGLLRFTLAR